MKRYWIIAAFCLTACLSGCSALQTKTAAQPPQTKAAAAKTETTSAPADTTEAVSTESPAEQPSDENDEDLNAALFRSAAAAAQMEITTGQTTEFLDMICSYPVTVVKGDEVTVLNNLDDLEKMGLKALYTEDLLKAVGEADSDAIEIMDGTAILGDTDGAYVVLGTGDSDVIGITEFHYPN